MKSFPMFIRTTDRCVVIAGGGEQAAQKARLILKTDARIVLAAPELDAELRGLVAQGRAVHEAGHISPESFRGSALAFVATGCAGADAALHALAKEGGAVVNVVDRPELCDATTPSIVAWLAWTIRSFLSRTNRPSASVSNAARTRSGITRDGSRWASMRRR